MVKLSGLFGVILLVYCSAASAADIFDDGGCEASLERYEWKSIPSGRPADPQILESKNVVAFALLTKSGAVVQGNKIRVGSIEVPAVGPDDDAGDSTKAETYVIYDRGHERSSFLTSDVAALRLLVRVGVSAQEFKDLYHGRQEGAPKELTPGRSVAILYEDPFGEGRILEGVFVGTQSSKILLATPAGTVGLDTVRQLLEIRLLADPLDDVAPVGKRVGRPPGVPYAVADLDLNRWEEIGFATSRGGARAIGGRFVAVSYDGNHNGYVVLEGQVEGSEFERHWVKPDSWKLDARLDPSQTPIKIRFIKGWAGVEIEGLPRYLRVDEIRVERGASKWLPHAANLDRGSR